MRNEHTEGLLSGLEKQLQGFAHLPPLERMRSEITAVREVLKELYGQIELAGFASKIEEIYFFKHVKPRFYSLIVFAVERYWYEQERPIKKGDVLEDFYERQLEHISRFFRQHEFFYQYYRLGADELDGKYFLKSGGTSVLINPDLPELDQRFATVGDYLFSKFMALESLRDMIVAEMQQPEQVAGSLVRSKKGRELKWTGDSCNLIELIYGVFDTRQVNGGEVDLSDLMDVFEQVFQINLSRYFRRFTEIKRRKTVSKTKYLDSMVEAVNRRIDEGDAYVPASMR